MRPLRNAARTSGISDGSHHPVGGMPERSDEGNRGGGKENCAAVREEDARRARGEESNAYVRWCLPSITVSVWLLGSWCRHLGMVKLKLEVHNLPNRASRLSGCTVLVRVQRARRPANYMRARAPPGRYQVLACPASARPKRSGGAR